METSHVEALNSFACILGEGLSEQAMKPQLLHRRPNKTIVQLFAQPLRLQWKQRMLSFRLQVRLIPIPRYSGYVNMAGPDNKAPIISETK